MEYLRIIAMRYRVNFAYSFLEICGIEICLNFTSKEIQNILKKFIFELKFIFLVQSQGETLEKHVESIKQQIEEIDQFLTNDSSNEYVSAVTESDSVCDDKAFVINCHSGCDYWTTEESIQFFNLFNHEIEFKYDHKFDFYHETHRGRILYSPWSALPILEAFPDLKLTADLSHWVVVAERHLNVNEFDKVMKLVYSRTRHIHARPCSPQHIQLSHLNDPIYQPDVNEFKKYWKNIINESKQKSITINPEFGPFPYSPVKPMSSSNGEVAKNLEENVDEIIELFKCLL